MCWACAIKRDVCSTSRLETILTPFKDSFKSQRKRGDDNFADKNATLAKTLSRVKCSVQRRRVSKPSSWLDVSDATSAQPRSRLCQLPPEILQIIAAHLPPHTQMALGLTCKTMLASVDLLWAQVCQQANEASKCGVLWLMASEFPSEVPYMGPRGRDRARPRPGWWGRTKVAPMPLGTDDVDILYVSLRDVLVVAAYSRLAATCRIGHLMGVKGSRIPPIWDEYKRPMLARFGFRLVNETLLMGAELEMKLPRKQNCLFSPRQQRCLEAMHCWHDEDYEEQLIIRLLVQDAEDSVASPAAHDSLNEIKSTVYRCRYCPTEIQYMIRTGWLDLDTYSLSVTTWRDLGSGRHDRSKAWIALQNTNLNPTVYEPCMWRPGALNEAYDALGGSWSTRHMQLPVLQSLESQNNDPAGFTSIFPSGVPVAT